MPRICTYILLLLCCLTNCQRVKPDLPVAQTYEPALTEPISYLAGQITFPIDELERKINKALDPVLVTEEAFEGKSGEAWRLRVERTGPVKIHYDNQQAFFSAPLRVLYSNPIALTKKRKSHTLCALAVNFASPLSVGENWRLTTRSQLKDYRWIQKPTIKLLGIKINVTKLADNILQKRRGDIQTIIDKAVRDELQLNKEVRKIWTDMQNPLRISKKPAELWLVPKPFSVATSPVRGGKNAIIVPIRIAFRVGTKIGEKPLLAEREPLPRLMRRDSLAGESSLHVLTFVSYQDINRVLSETVKNDKINLSGRKLTIKNAVISGGGKSLILKTDVTGIVNGTLYFRGKPNYDTLTNTLNVQNLDFDVQTRETLMKTADWLLHDSLRDTLQAVTVVPLSGEIAQLPTKIQTAFEQGGPGKNTDLDIETFRLIPQKLVIRPNGIQVLISVQSKINVTVRHI
jgi:hypothetical protein